VGSTPPRSSRSTRFAISLGSTCRTQPREPQSNLAGDRGHAELCAALRAEVGRRWDPAALRHAVLADQADRRLVVAALRRGRPERWDFSPRPTPAFVRGSDDLYALQRRARLDTPAGRDGRR